MRLGAPLQAQPLLEEGTNNCPRLRLQTSGACWLSWQAGLLLNWPPAPKLAAICQRQASLTGIRWLQAAPAQQQGHLSSHAGTLQGTPTWTLDCCAASTSVICQSSDDTIPRMSQVCGRPGGSAVGCIAMSIAMSRWLPKMTPSLAAYSQPLSPLMSNLHCMDA